MHAIQRLITNLLRWAPLILLLATSILFVASANRGLDLTDESYYLLNYLNWRNLSATSTFFGAYIEHPFHILGENIAAIRIFGLLLLFTGTAIFYHGLTKLFRHSTGIEITDHSANLFAALSACFLYYSFFFTLRAPSYNLISLFCILSGSGILFYVLSAEIIQTRQMLASMFYGLLISILFFTKATSAAALILIHIVFFFILGRQNIRHLLLRILPAAALGAGMNVALLSIADPHWLDTLIAGVAFGNTMDQRDQLALSSLFILGQGLLKDLLNNWIYYAGFLAINALVFLLPPSIRKIFGGWWLVGSIAAAVLMFVTKRPVATWAVISSVLYLEMWCADFLSRESRTVTRTDYFMFMLWAFLILTTLAFSIGTNIPLVRHSAMSFVLPFAGILLMLNKLRVGQVMSAYQHGLALTSFCVIALAFQVMPWVQAKYTYRLRAPLYAQDQPIYFPNSIAAVLVDKQTAAELDAFIGVLKSAGFKRGMEILDLTGDGPGLVYLAGGKPLGVAWLLGGYKGSSAALQQIVQLVGAPRVKCSWLLTSDDSHRHIADWRNILEIKASAFDHERIGEFNFSPGYSWGDAIQRQSTIVVWRPLGRDCGA